MGLCKCPKKKVTNQFCFEHRVNVCEHCMVINHPKCVVQSYLQWLQDSDYNPICELCKSQLDGECVRLTCYHVFHWSCLDQFAKSLPAHTAPAGYTCPSCQTAIFPAPNVVSPVADNLRSSLSKANWARPALGLPLFDSSSEDYTPAVTNGTLDHSSSTLASFSHNESLSIEPEITSWSSVVNTNTQRISTTASHTNTSFAPSSNIYPSSTTGQVSSPRKLYDATDHFSLLNKSTDHDENKYKRRSALEWLARWFKSRTNSRGRHDPHWKFKRWVVIAILVLLSFFTLIMVFIRFGRAAADDDPFLNPMANPQIRVNER